MTDLTGLFWVRWELGRKLVREMEMVEAWLVRVQRYIKNTGGTVCCYCKLRLCGSFRSAGEEESAVVTRDQQHHWGGITRALGSCAPEAALRQDQVVLTLKEPRRAAEAWHNEKPLKGSLSSSLRGHVEKLRQSVRSPGEVQVQSTTAAPSALE